MNLSEQRKQYRTHKDQFYVYVYLDPTWNDEPFYVGKGHEERAWSHSKRKDHHPLTQRLQKMSRNKIQPIIEIADCVDEDHAFREEIKLIACYGRKDLGLGPLLNLTDGGENPPKHFGNRFASRPHTPEEKYNARLKAIEVGNGNPQYFTKESRARGLATRMILKPWYKPENLAKSKALMDGKNNPNYGGKITEGQRWANNSQTNLLLKKGQPLPSGFIFGRLMSTHMGQGNIYGAIKNKIISCPHCPKSGGENVMHRWHFDNCKHRVRS